MTELKLSEAIRLGAMLKPQSTDACFYLGGATCALGAALDAVGQLERDHASDANFENVARLWPYSERCVQSPVHIFSEPLVEVIYDLNDNHGWTREQIADWVEQIEAQHAIPQSDPAPEVVHVPA